jgi:membrane-bound acyltransferase YfiQ involved in biofilm formation
MAQAGRLYDLEPGEAAYYAAQPTWFVVITDIALVAAIAASLALLSRKRMAVWLFALSLAAIVITNGYEFAAGTSRALLQRAALIVTVIIVLIAMFELAYAWAMKQRSVLR